MAHLVLRSEAHVNLVHDLRPIELVLYILEGAYYKILHQAPGAHSVIHLGVWQRLELDVDFVL